VAYNLSECYKHNDEQKRGTKKHAHCDFLPIKFKAGKENNKLCDLRTSLSQGQIKSYHESLVYGHLQGEKRHLRASG
ncbi:hypothetical protein ACQP3J_33440, partial [Escherichia coli]